MPSPTSSLATLRPDLGGSFEEFDLAANRQGFIGLRILPVIDSEESGGTFGKIPLEQLLKNADVNRRNKSGYARGDWDFEPVSFATKEYGFEEPVDRRDAKMYRNYFDAERVSAEIALNTVMLEAEKRYAAAIFNATTWNGASLTTAVQDEWDDYDNAKPIGDVEAAVRAVFALSGVWPNALIINRMVFRNLRLCKQIIDRITSSGAGSPAKPSDITAAMLAAVFDLEEVIVAGGAYNSAKEGQSATPGHIWSNEYAMVCRVGRSGSIKEPCIGNTIHWSADGSQVGGTMETYYDERVRGDVVRCRHDVDEKIKYKELGHLLSNITA